MRHLILIFTTLLIFSACQKDNLLQEDEPIVVTSNNQFPSADSRLWSYFEAFEEEASARGLQYDLVALNIEGVIRNINEEHVAGTCSYGGNNPHLVTIDREFWNSSSAIIREFIIFHELGHCVLLRDHDESSRNGVCSSIMRSGTTNCFDNYNATTRDTYIDELFSEMGN